MPYTYRLDSHKSHFDNRMRHPEAQHLFAVYFVHQLTPKTNLASGVMVEDYYGDANNIICIRESHQVGSLQLHHYSAELLQRRRHVEAEILKTQY